MSVEMILPKSMKQMRMNSGGSFFVFCLFMKLSFKGYLCFWKLMYLSLEFSVVCGARSLNATIKNDSVWVFLRKKMIITEREVKMNICRICISNAYEMKYSFFKCSPKMHFCVVVVMNKFLVIFLFKMISWYYAIFKSVCSWDKRIFQLCFQLFFSFNDYKCASEFSALERNSFFPLVFHN